MPSQDKDELIKERVIELSEHFEEFANIANEGRPDSPARYFHIKTMKRLGNLGLNSVFNDDLFFDYLYATLATWGMNSRGAQLAGYHSFVGSIRGNRDKILLLAQQSLSKLADDRIDDTADAIWEIVKSMNVSTSEIQLVAGSKALHHLLPSLVPPIDREYTLNFFCDNKSINRDIEEQGDKFSEIFSGYLLIYNFVGQDAERLTCDYTWNSSVTKTIDNAIIGYWKSRKSKT